jgi:hypothetical protein
MDKALRKRSVFRCRRANLHQQSRTEQLDNLRWTVEEGGA